MSLAPNSIVTNNSLPRQATGKLYLDHRTADVFFVIKTDGGNDVRIPAHKNILAASSTVFDELFYGPAKQEGDVTITGFSAAVFSEFLEFFYRATIKLTGKHKSELVKLGKQYKVNDCEKACSDLSGMTLTLDNVCSIYELAILLENDEFKQKCEQMIKRNAETVFRSPQFLEMGSNVIRHILQMELYDFNEPTVFVSCMAWAKAACERKSLDATDMKCLRSQLGDLLYDIQFGQMTLSTFFPIYKPYSDLFAREEIDEILGMIASHNFPTTMFNRNRRRHTFNEPLLMGDCVQMYNDFYLSSDVTSSQRTFFSNQSLLLKKICIGPFRIAYSEPVFEAEPVPVVISYSKFGNNHQEIHEVAVDPYEESVIEIPTPIFIEPLIKYTIAFSLKLDPNAQWEQIEYVHAPKEVVQIDGDIVIQFDRGNGGSLLTKLCLTRASED